jgi:hypothetical protein
MVSIQFDIRLEAGVNSGGSKPPPYGINLVGMGLASIRIGFLD